MLLRQSGNKRRGGAYVLAPPDLPAALRTTCTWNAGVLPHTARKMGLRGSDNDAPERGQQRSHDAANAAREPFSEGRPLWM